MSDNRTNDGSSDFSEDKIRARLRELTNATRQVRQELEELIRKPEVDETRGHARDTADDRER